MKCDIIIPVWNLLEYTKDCLTSLFKSTLIPFRLIIVDNASDPPTAQYLNSFSKDYPQQVLLIRNRENQGFVKAVNQGIKASAAPYVCLLNNDTQVTAGWLTEMIKVAQNSRNIGIVNANSNTLGCKLRKGQTLEELAGELKAHTGEYSELAWATGFCMLIKRKLIERIGPFDEVYGKGNFEDADFSKKAQHLGYLIVCAKAAYVYHRERQSFMKVKRFDQDFERNRQIFYGKWGRQQRILHVLTKDDFLHIEKLGAEALKLARHGHIVYIFSKIKNRQNLKTHSNIYSYTLPESLFNLISLWRILKRKKKFDRIFVDDEDYGKRLNGFKFWHKAEVIYVH